jgi:hypothetical protein
MICGMTVIHSISHLEQNNPYEGPGRIQFTHPQSKSKLSNHLSFPLPIKSLILPEAIRLILFIIVNINKDGGANEKKMCFSTGEVIPPTPRHITGLQH